MDSALESVGFLQTTCSSSSSVVLDSGSSTELDLEGPIKGDTESSFISASRCRVESSSTCFVSSVVSTSCLVEDGNEVIFEGASSATVRNRGAVLLLRLRDGGGVYSSRILGAAPLAVTRNVTTNPIATTM